MKTTVFFYLLLPAVLTVSCFCEPGAEHKPGASKEHIQSLTSAMVKAETSDDLPAFLSFYIFDAISMPEYQPTLDGLPQIEAFYSEIFRRQDIISFTKTTEEIFDIGNLIIEIGLLDKSFRAAMADTILSQHGKYWHVWQKQPDGTLKIEGEAFGFFHHVANPEPLTVTFKEEEWNQKHNGTRLGVEYPFELRAYNSMMEKGVQTRDGEFRSNYFTEDGSFKPFAEPVVNGMAEIKPYLIAYSRRGQVKIDSVAVFTYDARYLDGYVLEYDMFRVRWISDDMQGRTEGKGLRLWKRMDDHSLRLHREIGTHNHLK
jgi:ketosteroid isomerase-like protein